MKLKNKTKKKNLIYEKQNVFLLIKIFNILLHNLQNKNYNRYIYGIFY